MSNLINRLFFSLWYLRRPPWDTGVSPPELMDYIKSHPVGKALDLGCGTGTNVITLAKSGWQVVGVDFVRRAINLAKKNAKQYDVQVDLRVEDVTRLESVCGKFDLVLDIGCFHSLPPSTRQSYILKIDQLLADGGTFLLYLFLAANTENSATGATEADLHFITGKLHLLERQDGTERGLYPSAWLTLQKRPAP
jgi:cyclopropane fatty-acyl-phospholipid synthase-like methyltransferase